MHKRGSPYCEIIKCGWQVAVRTYLVKYLVEGR